MRVSRFSSREICVSLSILSSFACGSESDLDLEFSENESGSAITGTGREITTEFPFSGAISAGPVTGRACDTGQGPCSGTLIGEDVVLTAAHCGVKEGNYFNLCLDGSMTSFRIKAAENHPEWQRMHDAGQRMNSNDAFGSDVAVAVLDTPVPGVSPIKASGYVPGATTIVDVILVGWGRGDNASGTNSRKRWGVNSFRGGRMKKIFRLRNTNRNQVICEGDSGGSVVASSGPANGQLVAVSVAASGPNQSEDCDNQNFTLVAPVHNKVDWINSTAQRLQQD